MVADISTIQYVLLIICLVAACAFEFVNGFHDTANAVATVIYTNTLKPWVAVVWSGFWNFFGVMVGGITVAMGIVNLLPAETLTDPNIYHSIGMILALLFSAIIWNLGTWYFGLPASSSHTLIGSILGVGIAFAATTEGASAVNWSKAIEIGLSLLISPLFGFAATVFLMYILRRNVKNDVIFKEPHPQRKPPFWIRTVLVLTCTGVSYSHGSNDGQKGVGLVMLILICIVPAFYAVDTTRRPIDYQANVKAINHMMARVDTNLLADGEKSTYTSVISSVHSLDTEFVNTASISDIPGDKRFLFRKHIIVVKKGVEKLIKSGNMNLSANEISDLQSYLKGGKVTVNGRVTKVSGISDITDYSPRWVIIMISCSLGLGTMIGWKRIVKTIGEKIGKTHMTYAQGASAELVAASTIGLASGLGLPVSTTHVLSSGIAGSMVANKGLKNLQPKTVKNILLAWVLTLPSTIILSGLLYLLFRWLF